MVGGGPTGTAASTAAKIAATEPLVPGLRPGELIAGKQRKPAPSVFGQELAEISRKQLAGQVPIEGLRPDWTPPPQGILPNDWQPAETPQEFPREYDARGMPVGWDYRIAIKGPNGEPLPRIGSVFGIETPEAWQPKGWTPQGTPDWGPGLQGFLAETRWRLLGDESAAPAQDLVYGQAATQFREQAEQLAAQIRQAQPQGRFGPGNRQAATEATRQLFGLAVGYGIGAFAQQWHAGENNKSLGVVSLLLRSVGTGVFTLGRILQSGAQEYERKTVGPYILAADEVVRRSHAAEGTDVPAWWATLRRLGAIGIVPALMYANYRNLIGRTGGRAEASALLAHYRDIDAGRMAYSAWMEPARLADYERRLKASEDPRLLAMELEIPGAEAVGQTIFDPLNVIGFALGKIDRVAREARAAARAVASEEVRGAVRALGAAADGEAIAQRTEEAVAVISRASQDAEHGITRLAGRRGVTVLQASGKQAVIGQRMNNAFLTMLGHVKSDPDRFLKGVEAIARIATRVPEEIMRGLRMLAEADIPADIALSPNANSAGIFMRNMFLDEAGNFNGARIAAVLEQADSPGKASGLIESLYDSALKDAFPNVNQQIEQHAEYTRLLSEDAEEAARYLESHPAAERAVNRFQQQLAAIHDTAQSKFFGPAGTLQGHLYFSSPTYRWKNRWGNFAPMLDFDPVAAFKSLVGWSPARANEETAALLGGVLPESAQRGLSGAAAGIVGGERERAGLLYATRRGAAADEIAGAAHIVRKSVGEVMDSAFNVLDHAVEQIPGLSPENQRVLSELIRQNHGDIDAALAAFRGGAATGVPISRTGAAMSAETAQSLRDLRAFDPVMDAIRAGDGDLASVERALDDFVAERAKFGARAGTETAILDSQTPAGQAAGEVAQTLSENIGEPAADVFARSANAIEQAIEELDRAADEIEEIARREITLRAQRESVAAGQTDDAIARGYDAAQQMVNEAAEPFRGRATELTDQTFRDARQFSKDTHRLSDISHKADEPTLRSLWRTAGLGEEPEHLTQKAFREALWNHYWDAQRARFIARREALVQLSMQRAEAMAGIAGTEARTAMRARAEASLATARMFDNAQMVRGAAVTDIPLPDVRAAVEAEYQANLLSGLDETTARERALTAVAGRGNEADLEKFLAESAEGKRIVFTQTEPGKPPGRWASEARRYGGDVYVAEVSEAEWQKAVQAGIEENAANPARGATVQPGAQITEGLLPEGTQWRRAGAEEFGAEAPTWRFKLVHPADTAPPSLARFMHESQGAAEEIVTKAKQELRENWARIQEPLSRESELALDAFGAEAKTKIATARATAIEYARATRDFILHNYGKKYGGDLLAGYIFPYQFWTSRTYAKWMRRLVTNPGLIATYFRYRSALEKMHAGLPEWWRYNLNTNELLGLNAKNPLYFNLESFLNPLYGLTGVDFTDPNRRLDWWSALLEDIGKFGPGTWAPFQWATALYYHVKGEDEAAARWAGRLTSVTRTVRDLTALVDPRGLGVELDPLVMVFGEGFEGARVGRALGSLVQEGIITEAQAEDAGQRQEGDVWDLARARAIHDRAPNVASIMAPFFLGAGFKQRTQSDIEIDRMYSAIGGLFANRTNLTSEEFGRGFDQIQQQYPFMTTVLLSRKGGLERDEAFAWAVLSRIPPGMSTEIAKAVGLERETLDAFYDNKGDLSTLSEADRMKFMGSILDAAAILDVPSGAVQQEWQTAKDAYSQMRTEAERQWGGDIWDRVDAYYALKSDDPDAARDYLNANPAVEEALDFKSRRILLNPVLRDYYGSLGQIESYYRGAMYDAIEQRLGTDVWDTWAEYWRLKDTGGNARAYYRQHPELAAYSRLKNQWESAIAQHMTQFADLLPERRLDLRETSPLAQEEIAPAEDNPITWDRSRWVAEVGEPVVRLIEDTNYGARLPSAVYTAVQRASERLDVSVEAVIAYIQHSTEPMFTP